MVRREKELQDWNELQDWELAKVALSCHMALDMLYQEMNGPLPLLQGPLSQQEEPFSHRGRAVTKNGEGCGERMKEKEREQRALLSFVELASFFESSDVRHGVLVERGSSSFCVPL